ncbi:ABC transporter ATP-binding protein [Anaerotalea alkaliphila]|uniref:ABC transporter ATP-binding protein n=1 Tax=Anaerotalea alkaliphila TaxID=2662126 RepID=A0A7X5HW11_9FIRM|nr:ABC transporter ATP-binding protein [Anaerotalea alkaliphila]NDL67687.1 ABC transporter ATP-binding protein [Anaerotalea alkaliphila]
MAKIDLVNVTKRFNKTVALDGIDLTIHDKEFFVLFGPAGAGKTTLLKVIAGVEFPEVGEVRISDENVNLVEPAKRNISMVFENYALYPHMNIFDNIASPMRSPLYKKDEATIKREVHKVASMMKIDHLLERLPSQVSNGQRQRTALGRALVRDPNVFLMDEPIAHLDAKLRHVMRAELKEMQHEFSTTTIYVTHDYLEALSLGDRVGIINEGKIVQIGTGEEVYLTPANEFVARLMGDPEINIFEIDLVDEDGVLGGVMLGQKKPHLIPEDVAKVINDGGYTKIRIGLRGNDFNYSFTKVSPEYMDATVYSVEPIGNKTILVVDVNGEKLRVIAPNDIKVELDQPIYVNVKMDKAMFFNAEDGNFIIRHNQKQLLEVD